MSKEFNVVAFGYHITWSQNKKKKDIEPEMLHRNALIRSLLIHGNRSFISRNSGN